MCFQRSSCCLWEKLKARSRPYVPLSRVKKQNGWVNKLWSSALHSSLLSEVSGGEEHRWTLIITIGNVRPSMIFLIYGKIHFFDWKLFGINVVSLRGNGGRAPQPVCSRPELLRGACVVFTVTTSPGNNPTHGKSRGTSALVHFHMLHTCMCKFSISPVWQASSLQGACCYSSPPPHNWARWSPERRRHMQTAFSE